MPPLTFARNAAYREASARLAQLEAELAEAMAQVQAAPQSAAQLDTYAGLEEREASVTLHRRVQELDRAVLEARNARDAALPELAAALAEQYGAHLEAARTAGRQFLEAEAAIAALFAEFSELLIQPSSGRHACSLLAEVPRFPARLQLAGWIEAAGYVLPRVGGEPA